MTMTFMEAKELLQWARANRVAQLKLGAALIETNETRDIVPTVEAVFYPETPAQTLPVQMPTTDWRARVDQDAFGGSLEREP